MADRDNPYVHLGGKISYARRFVAGVCREQELAPTGR